MRIGRAWDPNKNALEVERMNRFIVVIAFVIAMAAAPLLLHAAAGDRRLFDAVVARKPDVAHGAQVFAACARCHGTDGSGQMTGSVPRIAGQHYRVIVQQIVEFRSGKHWDMRMEDVAKSHELLPSPQDIADVAAYVSALARDGNRGVGDGQSLDRGAAIYAAGCASCHGLLAQGDDLKGIPRIAGQHEGYLLRQIYDAVDGRRPALTQTHKKRLQALSFEETRGLADYLSRIGSRSGAQPGDAAAQ
jgi:cytochrome c553